MSEKKKIRGDITQAVRIDVHEAPRLHNIVTLNIGEKRQDPQLITDYQHGRINNLVKKLASIISNNNLAIHKIIIANSGLMKIKELPINLGAGS